MDELKITTEELDKFENAIIDLLCSLTNKDKNTVKNLLGHLGTRITFGKELYDQTIMKIKPYNRDSI